MLNATSTHYGLGEIAFELFHVPDDAEALLNLIKFALVSHEQREERHLTVRAIREDHEPLPQLK
jgi:hypothetical protein